VIAGMNSHLGANTIPSAAYTGPVVAWMGITEEQARADGNEHIKGVFPWAASGCSLSIGRNEGQTKAMFEKASHRISAPVGLEPMPANSSPRLSSHWKWAPMSKTSH